MPYFVHIATADSYDYLLDDISGGSFGYSIRKLRSAYVGFAMEIRRDSDNATTNVNFDGSNTVSGSSTVSAGGDLTTWAGAANLYVRTWYDQSTSGLDMVQTTDSQQPQLILSDTHSLPAVVMDSINDYMINNASNVFSGHTDGTIFITLRNSTNDTNYPITSSDTATSNNIFALRNYNAAGQNFSTGFQTFNTAPNGVYGDNTVQDGNWYYCMYGSNGTAWSLRRNGSAETSNVLFGSNVGNWFGDVAGRDNLVMGGLITNTSQFLGGRYSELVYFNPNLSAGNITTAETNISTFYGL